MQERNAVLIEELNKTSIDLGNAILHNQCELKIDQSKEPIIAERRQLVLDGILEHLKNHDKALSSIVIDAETGYGKTYDIGLLSHASAKKGYSHLVVVQSDELVDQAKDVMNKAFPLDICTPDSSDALIELLQQKDSKPITIIVSHDLLLSNKNFMQLKEFLFNKEAQGLLIISIDEADSINDTISSQSFQNLRELDTQAKNKPLYYWTATPDPRFTDNMCSTVISPSRSKRKCIATVVRAQNFITKTNRIEKFKLAVTISLFVYVIPYFLIRYQYVPDLMATLGFTANGSVPLIVIPLIYDLIAFSVIAILMSIVTYVNKRMFNLNLGINYLKRILTNFISLFDSVEDPNPVYEYVEQCEETFEYREIQGLHDMDNRSFLIRWNIHSPIGESALILADEVDNIMNLNFALQGKDTIYQNGKTFSMNRYKLYDRIQPEGIDYKQYRKRLCESNFISCVKQHYPNIPEDYISELKNKVDFESSTPQYLKYRVMHGLIDITLQYIMERDNTKLDKMRQTNLSALVYDITHNEKIQKEIFLSGIVDFLKKKGFSEEFARNQLYLSIEPILDSLLYARGRELIVDNWHLSKDLHVVMDDLMNKNPKLNSFCENNKCIFAKLGKNDFCIEEHRPFFEIEYKNNKYDPKYCNYEKCDITALAQSGLITFIDGSKGRGFDSEYNHVVSMFTQSYSQYNSPVDVIQNLGRNRERNPARQSWFFAAVGCKTQLFIEDTLSSIHSEPKVFYSNVLFPAQKQFNKLKKNRMGIELGEKIEEYVANVVNNKIKDEDFHSNIGKLINSTLEELYQMNNKMNCFDEKRTCKEMQKILNSTKKYLITYGSRIRNKNRLPILYKIPCYAISIMLKSTYYMAITFDKIIFKIQALSISKKVADSDKMLTYVYIINNYSAEKVLRCQKIMDKAYSLANNRNVQDVQEILSLFHNKIYSNALNQSISLLLSDDSRYLLTILDALYIDENNSKKLDEIVRFKKNLTRLSPKEMIDEDLYSSSELLEIIGWINKVNDEIVKCQKYYYNIDTDEGDISFCLKTSHNIFNMRSYLNIYELGKKDNDIPKLNVRSCYSYVYSIFRMIIMSYFCELCQYAFMNIISVIPTNYIDCLFHTLTIFTQATPLSVNFMNSCLGVCALTFYIAWSTACSFMFNGTPLFMKFLFDFNINKDVLYDINELEFIDKQGRMDAIIRIADIIKDVERQMDTQEKVSSVIDVSNIIDAIGLRSERSYSVCGS